jgi:hypothetical protein
MQGKTIYADRDETRKVTNEWAGLAEERGSSVSSSTWEATGSLTLGASSLSGTTATVLVTVDGCGTVSNTVTLANSEVLVVRRDIKA